MCMVLVAVGLVMVQKCEEDAPLKPSHLLYSSNDHPLTEQLWIAAAAAADEGCPTPAAPDKALLCTFGADCTLMAFHSSVKPLEGLRPRSVGGAVEWAAAPGCARPAQTKHAWLVQNWGCSYGNRAERAAPASHRATSTQAARSIFQGANHYDSCISTAATLQ